MTTDGAVVVVGGTRAIGLEIARHYAEAGSPVVITGQSRDTVDAGLVVGLLQDAYKASGPCAGSSSWPSIATRTALPTTRSSARSAS